MLWPSYHIKVCWPCCIGVSCCLFMSRSNVFKNLWNREYDNEAKCSWAGPVVLSEGLIEVTALATVGPHLHQGVLALSQPGHVATVQGHWWHHQHSESSSTTLELHHQHETAMPRGPRHQVPSMSRGTRARSRRRCHQRLHYSQRQRMMLWYPAPLSSH